MRKLVLLTSVSFVLILVVIEVVLRFIMGNFMIAPLRPDPGDGRCVGLVPNGAVRYTGWWLRVPEVIHDANRFGYRGEARPETSDGADLRIAALGDSFTYGQGVTAGQAIPAQLEKDLRHATSWNIEVLNFGVPGINLKEAVEQYACFARRWRPDLVLVFLFDNDLGAPLCDWSHHGASLWFLRHVYLYRFAFIMVLSGSMEEEYAARAPHAPQDRLLASLESLEALARTDGARVAVIVLSDPIHDQARLEAITHKAGVALYYLDALHRGEARRIRGDGHFTVEGNRWVARQVARWLLGSDLLSPRASHAR